MTFWQGFVIQIMGSLGMVNEKAALQIQNLLICIEMLIASLAHFYIFPYHEWQEGYKREKEKNILLRDTLALRDFVRDMRMMVTTWDPAPETGQSAMEEKTENPNMNIDTDYEDNGNNEKDRGDSNGNGYQDEYDGQGREGGEGQGRESSDHIGISMIDILPIKPSRTKNETVTSLSIEQELNSRNYSQGYPTSTTTSFIPPSSDTKNRPLKKSTSTSTSQQEGKGAFEFFNPLHFPTIPSMSRLSDSNSYTSIPDDDGTWTESLELKGSENSRVLAAAIGSIDKNILELKGLGFDVGPDINNEIKKSERENNVTLRDFNSQGNDKIVSRKLPYTRSNEETKNIKVGGRGGNDGNGVIKGKETRGVGMEKGDEMFLTSSGSSRSDIAYSFNSNSDDYMDSNVQQSQSQSQTWQSRLSSDKDLNKTCKTKNKDNDKDKVKDEITCENYNNNKNSNNNDNNKNNAYDSPKGLLEKIPSSDNPNESVALRKRSWSSSKKKKSGNLKRESYSSYEGGEEDEESDDDNDDDEGDSESSSNSERDDDTTSNNQNKIHKKTSLPLYTGDGTSSTARQTAYFPFNAFTPSQPPILNSISTETESSWRTADDEARTEGAHVHTVSDLQPDSGSELEPDLESTTLEPSVRTVTGDGALLSSQQSMNNTEIHRRKSADREGKGGGMGEKMGEREEIEEEADVYKQIYNSYDDYRKTDTPRYEDVEVKGSAITGPKSSIIDPQRDSVVMTSASSCASSAGTDTAGPRTNLESDVPTAVRTSLQQDSVSDQRNGNNSSTMELESGSRSMPVPVEGDGVVFGLDLLEEESV